MNQRLRKLVEAGLMPLSENSKAPAESCEPPVGYARWQGSVSSEIIDRTLSELRSSGLAVPVCVKVSVSGRIVGEDVGRLELDNGVLTFQGLTSRWSIPKGRQGGASVDEKGPRIVYGIYELKLTAKRNRDIQKLISNWKGSRSRSHEAPTILPPRGVQEPYRAAIRKATNRERRMMRSMRVFRLAGILIIGVLSASLLITFAVKRSLPSTTFFLVVMFLLNAVQLLLALRSPDEPIHLRHLQAALDEAPAESNFCVPLEGPLDDAQMEGVLNSAHGQDA